MLRRMEERVRNTVAHEIVPFGRREIEAALQWTGESAIGTPEDLADRLREFLENMRPFSPDYWQSYEAMNAHIIEALRPLTAHPFPVARR